MALPRAVRLNSPNLVNLHLEHPRAVGEEQQIVVGAAHEEVLEVSLLPSGRCPKRRDRRVFWVR